MLLPCALGCGAAKNKVETPSAPDAREEVAGKEVPMAKREVVQETIGKLVEQHTDAHRGRIERGVHQVAVNWRSSDGDDAAFQAFCLKHFLADEAQLGAVHGRIQDNLEQIRGHLLEVERYLREPTDLDRGDMLPVDQMFAGYDLRAHMVEDLFASKIAFVALLNFEDATLDEMLESGGAWSRDTWARVRLAQMFSSRVPSDVEQKITEAFVRADDYINNYNIHMHHLLTEDGRRLFPEDLRLISHWGLRDELKAQYGQDGALERQRMIFDVMEAILTQEIPAVVIDNPEVDWVVAKNEVRPAGEGKEKKVEAKPEAGRRYEKMLETFKAVRLADPYHPKTPTYVDRKFEVAREIPKEQVVVLLESVLTAPVLEEVGALVSKRLGRPLEPFDVWYNGFTSRGDHAEKDLDAKVRAKYPSLEAFQKDIPKILRKLGFDKKTADFLASKIVVDPARGAGHAWGADRREDKAHLRTRVGKDGMNYKGYNIAVHELGHNVEQVFSLNMMDHNLLAGVPNTAFTEGFAFTFQSRDLELLGLPSKSPDKKHLTAVDTIWSTAEIAGVAMVDIALWDWLYENPDATPKELGEATVRIAKDVWNRYFARVFKVEDQIHLAIYSHIIDGAMYTPDYPIGLIIQYQLEKHFEEKGLAGEMERMCRLGMLTPAAWMQEAVGAQISARPLIEDAVRAVEALK